MVEFDGPLTKSTAPRGIWFTANTYQGSLIDQTVYPLEHHSNDKKVPALPIDINTLLCGPGRWILYKGDFKNII